LFTQLYAARCQRLLDFYAMTELIWEGKYVDGKRQSPVRVALPFQTIETVNESAADRLRSLELFSSGRLTEWRNRLIWGDKKYVLPSLLPEFAGKMNLIYIDPPFDTGADFSFTATIPKQNGSDDESESFTKQPSILEQKAYRDTWGRGLQSYLAWFYDAAVILHELLDESGSIYVHLDYRLCHYAKVVLDEVFGLDNFQNQIVWRRTGSNTSPSRYGNNCDFILFYTKASGYKWNQQHGEYDADYIASHYTQKEQDGRLYQLVSTTGAGATATDYAWRGLRPPRGRHWAFSKEKMEELERSKRLVHSKSGMPRVKYYLDEQGGPPLQCLWSDIKVVNSQAAERVDYPTQKPEALLERIIKASSNEGDLVLDCFVGSGTTAVVAERLGRKWIACDLGRFAIHTTRKRLLSTPRVKPFAVQNLGKYERQAWQNAEFQTGEKTALEQQRQRETAYRKFILDLYRATPLTGKTWLHGLKSGRFVHVGAVDAPVTITDVKAIARETWKMEGTGGQARKAAADILGWEFAFELNETARQVAGESRVDVAFKKIPREVLEKKAVEQGDVKFFELGALSVETELKGQELRLAVTDFIIPIDDIPEEARKAIKHGSQLIDYWAIDWDFKNDTFHNQWQSYRTRQNSDLILSTKYEYDKPGTYRVVIKVIDILGNDTTKTLEIKVK
jgi:adenine-specific DNA-methyltransferase